MAASAERRVRLACVACGAATDETVVPLSLAVRDRATSAERAPALVPEPGDTLRYVEIDGRQVLAWFHRREAFTCPACGGPRVQVETGPTSGGLA